MPGGIENEKIIVDYACGAIGGYRCARVAR
jgi:hypothetical protein